MARDDFSVLALKILACLYVCMKNGETPSEKVLSPYAPGFPIKGEPINEVYWESILYMLQEEGLIKGAEYTNAWGEERIRINGVEDLKITLAGIQYLHDNQSMKKALSVLKESGDLLAGVISKLLGVC